MKAKVLSFGLLIALGLSIALVSSCKKENVEPMTNQTVQATHLDLSNWWYDVSNEKIILKTAGYKEISTKGVYVEWDGPAVDDPDSPSGFKCSGYDVVCYIEITPDKGNKDVVLTTQGEPTVIKGVEGVNVNDNGEVEIIY